MARNGLLMWRHTFYERLCAKAAYGGASDEDFNDLVKHLQTCSDCRTLLRDFMRVIADVLPQIAEGYGRANLSGDIGSSHPRNSVVAAINEKRKSGRLSEKWPLFLGWCMALVLSAALLITYSQHRSYGHEHSTTTPVPASQPRPELNHPAEREAAIAAALSSQLHSQQLQISELQSELKNAKAATIAAQAERAQLLARIDSHEKEIAEQDRNAHQQAALVLQFQQQLADKEAVLKSKDTALASMNSRLSEATEQSTRQREINVTLRKAQDLIAARDLHVISVSPMEPHGKSSPFGRILYAEGKELMFYGYDLGGSSQLADATFHVWGEKIGSSGSTRSLGVFSSDDKSAGRWRLTFTDADVLAHIDRVFVTIESTTEAISRPRGKTILLAYLGDKPNHP